jgi:hypothetical protein
MLLVLSSVHGLLAAEFGWERAWEMLRKGHGIPSTDAMAVSPYATTARGEKPPLLTGLWPNTDLRPLERLSKPARGKTRHPSIIQNSLD